MKKIIITLLVLFLSITLMSCGEEPSSTDSSNSSLETSSIVSTVENTKSSEVTIESSSSEVIIESSSSEESKSSESLPVESSTESISSESSKEDIPEHDSYADYLAGADEDSFTLKAEVASFSGWENNQITFLNVTIEGNPILLYQFGCTKAEAESLTANTVFIFTGNKLNYNNTTLELTNGSLVEVIGKSNGEYYSPSEYTKKVVVNGNTATYSGKLGNVTVTRGEKYDQKLDVALYLYAFKELPVNYFNKSSYSSHLGESMTTIGGDTFSNRNMNTGDAYFPLNKSYIECDIDNWKALRDSGTSKRGILRIVYASDYSSVYYTYDHYDSFNVVNFND